MIDAVLAAGKVPVLPTIPYSTNTDVNKYLDSYNAQVQKLYSEYGDKLVYGSDFDKFFRENTNLLGDDGVHPSFEGYEAMRKLWAETMYANVYTAVQSSNNPSSGVKGDVNADGKFDIADIVMLQKWLLAVPDMKLNDWKAGDLCEDDRIDAFDLCMMRELLVEGTSFIPVTYEAENAVSGGTNKVVDDTSASGGKAVGSFSGDSDTVSFNIEVPANGVYQLIFKSKGLGGDKENNVVVDGTPIGTFKSTGDSYSESVLRSVMLTAGKHTVTVTKSWGWINIDYLQIKQDQAISDSVYNVSNKLINSKANAETQKLFDYLCESYGKVTLSGQVCDDGLNGAEFKSIYEVTGKYPAICGLDMMDYTPSRTALGTKG